MTLEAAGKEALRRVAPLAKPPPPPEKQVLMTGRGIHAFLFGTGLTTLTHELFGYNTQWFGFSGFLFLTVLVSIVLIIVATAMGGYVGDEVSANFDRGDPELDTWQSLLVGMLVGPVLAIFCVFGGR